MSLAGASKSETRKFLRRMTRKERREFKSLRSPGVAPLLVRGPRGHRAFDPNPRQGKHRHASANPHVDPMRNRR